MKKIKLILIGFILVSISFAIFAYVKQKNNNDVQIRLADYKFRESLSLASNGFAVDYSKMNDDTKVYYYIQTSSNLYTAINIIDMTSYKDVKNRNALGEAIYNLYLCMTHDYSRKEILKDNNMSSIFNCLAKISNDPEDEEDCKRISRLAGDLYFNNNK
ncbi:hypothetical protein [Clostridium fungisolvens]|uniref:Uncharacterized protein n=1 Tax=Clostridium fungisolvens TaxID=1604897 RepID=A0A6V8SEI8_9CLOT|nr:hypothetical protein [Clostridium fungisolvens]GFP75136.1 hypothetical protein bsdtw1_01207 [Clostridium fungisolvens]